MKTAWTSGLKGKEKESMESAYKRSLSVRKRLKGILDNKCNADKKKARSEDLYDSPNWALRQADSQGYLRALHEVLSLIE